MMNRDDLVAEYDKISNEINVLSKRKLAVKDELLKLSEEEYDSVCAKWQQFVGKCFKKECVDYTKYSQYFIIIDVPKIENSSTYGKVYNKYKVKAFMFQPIDSITEVKTITSDAVNFGNFTERFCENFTPISFDEFMTKLRESIFEKYNVDTMSNMNEVLDTDDIAIILELIASKRIESEYRLREHEYIDKLDKLTRYFKNHFLGESDLAE